jgi:hypothetical protein
LGEFAGVHRLKYFIEIFLLCDRRRRRAVAFWISLFWVAFCFWGLDCLQVEAEKGTRRVGAGWQGLEKANLLFD